MGAELKMRVLAAFLLVGTGALCQEPPSTPSRPWVPPDTGTPLKPRKVVETTIDGSHIYTLPELVDLAEEYNPDTRVAWEAAKIRGRSLRIAESELLPSLTAIASTQTSRQNNLFGDTFARQTVSFFSPYLTVNYTILDFGARGSRIAAARDELLAANFAFNSVHLGIVFETSRRYYRLLNAWGQQAAAQANLQNAETLEKAIYARMTAGLATVTDDLEAKSAAAEAQFRLEAAIGQVDIARGDLLTLLGARPLDVLQVQALSNIQVPLKIEEAAEAAIERALAERPELLQRAAEERAENYLSRAITESDLLTGRGNFEDNLRMLQNIGAKFVGRAIYRWGAENALPALVQRATPLVVRIHKMDPDIIVQAAIFEAVSDQVNSLPIPPWVFTEFGLPVEPRNFLYQDMLYSDGTDLNRWSSGKSVPDITRQETQLFFFYLGATYIDLGMEGIHWGQINLMARNDPHLASWFSLLGRLRHYASLHARRHFVLFDAHAPDHGYVDNGRLLLDFHSVSNSSCRGSR